MPTMDEMRLRGLSAFATLISGRNPHIAVADHSGRSARNPAGSRRYIIDSGAFGPIVRSTLKLTGLHVAGRAGEKQQEI